jgi:hypothetical protein
MRRTAVVLVGLTLVYGVQASAAVLCRDKKSGRIAARDATCKKKETRLDLSQFGALGPQGSQGLQGPEGPRGLQGLPGAPGSPGADGQLRIYGDGSAGARTFDAGGSIGAPGESQFTDLTIASPVGVSSGTVIRCTGNFTITAAGSLGVGNGVSGGFTFSSAVDGDTLTFPLQAPHPGWSPRLASNGEVTGSAGLASGGIGGNAIPAATASWLLQPGIFGGGGGGNSSLGAGGPGGGAMVILVQGTFTNQGVITADGDRGSGASGGGGGGIIVIASRTGIVNSGTINARGGESTDVLGAAGSGGGGGGGIVHLLAPVVTEGTIDVSGGSPGTVASGATSGTHTAGAGGGGSGGNGGGGGDVPAGNPTNPGQGQPGSPGLVLMDLVDPTSLF